MKSRCVLCVFALLLGCSSSESGGDGGAAGTGEPVAFSIATQASQGPVPLGPALEGVEVCETDTSNCVTTDANGEAVLMLPANQQVSYSLSKEGYGTFLAGDVTDETFVPFATWPLFSNAQLEDNAENRVMIPWPWTGGVIALGSSMTGVTYDLIDGTGKQWYKEEDWNVSLGLTATTSVGQGGFAEVSPGEYQVELGGTAINCTPLIAWPGNEENRVRVPVKVGHLSFASMSCDTREAQ